MNENIRLSVCRWVYRRGQERIGCVLAAAADRCEYEFSVSRVSGQSSTSVDRFKDVGKAVACHSTYEGGLISEGWSLETFQTSVLNVSTQ
jgi:hypothetical protein